MSFFQGLNLSGGRVRAKLDLYNYATNANLKNQASVNTSKFAKQVDLSNLTNISYLKSERDKLHIDRLVPISVDLIKLTDVPKVVWVIRGTMPKSFK